MRHNARYAQSLPIVQVMQHRRWRWQDRGGLSPTRLSGEMEWRSERIGA